MSVYLSVHLDCNGPGCEARFVPSPATTSTPRARELAAAAGWLANLRNQGVDYCVKCADAALPGRRNARGICSGCGVEREVTLQALIKQHRARNRYGALSPCPGGGLPPRVLVRMAAPQGSAWKSLI